MLRFAKRRQVFLRVLGVVVKILLHFCQGVAGVAGCYRVFYAHQRVKLSGFGGRHLYKQDMTLNRGHVPLHPNP